MKRFFSLLNIFRRDFITLIIAMKNPGTPWRLKFILLLAAIYLISPVDFLPDFLPLAGVFDDILVVPTAMYSVMSLLPPVVRMDSERKAASVSKRMPLILAGATLFVVLWVCLIVYALYSFVKWLF